MNTQLLVVDDNGKYQHLDMYNDLSVNVIIQQTDITDITARKSPYSKVFQLPGTKKNNDFFGHFYEVNGISFDPIIKRSCVVQYNGTDIFKGYLRLNKVTKVNDQIEYDVYILSEISDFSSLIGNITLKDLSWDDLNHIQDYTSVRLSWYADGTDDNGLYGGKVLYPMVHWGYEYQGTTGTTTPFTFQLGTTGDTSLDYSGNSIAPTYFKPSIRIKEVVDRILATTGYEIVSDFFDSDYFRSIYMDIGLDGNIGPITAEDKVNQNIFRVYTPDYPGQELKWSDGQFHLLQFGRIDETDGYDPSLNFDEDAHIYQIPYTGEYNFEFIGKINQRYNNNSVVTYYGFTLFAANTPEGLLDPAQRRWAKGTPDNYSALNEGQQNNRRVFFNNVQLNAGEYIGLFIRFNPSRGSNRDAGLRVLPRDGFEYGARWDLYESPQFIANNFVDMKLQMPDITAIDFIKGIITLFNLVVVQTEEEKRFRIEPLNWYYSANFAETKDWTQKIDNAKAIEIEPLNFQLKKEYNFQYQSGGDEYLNKQWEVQNIIPYGSKRFVAKSDILTDSETIVVPFAPCPTEVISGSTNIIIPQVFRYDEGTGREVPYSTKNHLFFWVGNRHFYKDEGYVNPTYWYMTSGATPVQQTTYPCISHLSNLDTLVTQEMSDLNFDKNFDFFSNDNDIIPQFTEYNLYNLWYRDYFTNLYSPEVRRVKAKILFEPLDIYNTKLTDKIYIKDSIYYIEKINEGDLVNKKLTDISLIKQVAQYNKFVPPSPVYDIMPGQEYPSSGATFELSGYVMTDKFEICQLPSGMTTFYCSTSGLTEGSYLYYDEFGTSAFTQGTFVRENMTSMVYVTINNFGFIVEDPC